MKTCPHCNGENCVASANDYYFPGFRGVKCVLCGWIKED
jgi:hypothetical protein